MSAAACIYLYGIVDRSLDDRCLRDWMLDGVSDGARLEMTSAGRIAAVHTDMSAEELSGVDAEVVEGSRLAELARRHDAVITSLASLGAVLPVRLGTLLPERAALATLLQEEHTGLADALDNVRGCAEWQVRVARAAAPAEAPEPVEPAAVAVGGGTVYLLDRRRARRRAVEQYERFYSVLEAVDEALALLAKDTAGPLLATGSARRRSYLVPQAEQPAFVSIVEQGVAQLTEVGGDLRVRGPLPPYSFSGVQLGGGARE